MRLATWNVNSLRSRIDRVEAFLERHDVDVLALQETKARLDQLPLMGLQSMGYEVAAAGVNQWNGVAIISRVGLDDVEVGFPDQPSFGDPAVVEARAIGATCGGVRVWSLYVPNGRKIGDPHYVYKLDWLARLRTAAAGWLDTPTALVGDWNIAPTDEDVYDIAAFATETHVTPPERAAFQAFLDDGYADVARPFTPGPGVYTYWDYYRQRFERNRGLRIDFVLGSPSFAARVTGAFIDRDERAGTGRLRPRARGRRLASRSRADMSRSERALVNVLAQAAIEMPWSDTDLETRLIEWCKQAVSAEISVEVVPAPPPDASFLFGDNRYLVARRRFGSEPFNGMDRRVLAALTAMATSSKHAAKRDDRLRRRASPTT